MLPGLAMSGLIMGATSSSSPSYTLTYRGNFSISASTSTVSVDIGTASADREVFIVANVIANSVSGSLTDGTGTTAAGVNTTKVSTETLASVGGGLYLVQSLARATVTSGSGSQSIKVTFGDTVTGYIYVYTVAGRPGIGTGQDDASTSGVTTSNPVTTNGTTISDGGIWIGVCFTPSGRTITAAPSGTTIDAGSSSNIMACSRSVQSGSSTPSDSWDISSSGGNSGATSWSFK